LCITGCDFQEEDNGGTEINEENLNKLLGKDGSIEIKDEKTTQELNEIIEHGFQKIFDNTNMHIQYTTLKYNSMFITELKENKISHKVIMKEGREANQIK